MRRLRLPFRRDPDLVHNSSRDPTPPVFWGHYDHGCSWNFRGDHLAHTTFSLQCKTDPGNYPLRIRRKFLVLSALAAFRNLLMASFVRELWDRSHLPLRVADKESILLETRWMNCPYLSDYLFSCVSLLVSGCVSGSSGSPGSRASFVELLPATPLFLFIPVTRISLRDPMYCTLSFNCVQVQTLPTAQATPGSRLKAQVGSSKLKLRLRACFACLHDSVCFCNIVSDTDEQTTVSELPAILHDGQRDASRITHTDVVDTDEVSPEWLDDPSTAAELMGRLLKNRVVLAVSFTTITNDTKEFTLK